MAEQLTLLGFDIFARIETKEFAKLAWSRKGREVKAPNITAMIRHSNKVSDWVATTILLGSTHEKRAKLCLSFIAALEVRTRRSNDRPPIAIAIDWWRGLSLGQPAQHCLRINSFGAAMEIMSGLNSTPVNILLTRWIKEGVCAMQRPRTQSAH